MANGQILSTRFNMGDPLEVLHCVNITAHLRNDLIVTGTGTVPGADAVI